MAERLWEWWRSKQRLVDAAFVLPVALLVVLQLPTAEYHPDRMPPLPGYLLLHGGLLVPMVWRRRFPAGSFAVVALTSFVQWCLDWTMLPGNITVLIGLYTVTAYRSANWGVAAALVTYLGAALQVARLWWPPSQSMLDPLLTFIVVCSGVWLLGVYMRTRRQYLRSLEDRAERLERERDNELQMARSAERARIARELHDVVAHNVSVIVVQADGASFAIDGDPGRAKQAIAAIGETGRTALAEMRRLLGVLRESDDGSALRPQPGMADLDDLVRQIRRAGVDVELTVRGEPPPVPPGFELTLYRIVQEALTNTLKHGGPQVSAHVVLDHRPGAVLVRVDDDGRGAAAPDDGLGHGLHGMRERVAVYGGEVRAGFRPGGGFQVFARLPVAEARPDGTGGGDGP